MELLSQKETDKVLKRWRKDLISRGALLNQKQIDEKMKEWAQQLGVEYEVD